MRRLVFVFTLCTILILSADGFGNATEVIDDNKEVIRLVTAETRSEADHSIKIFFNLEDLRIGNKLHLFLPRLNRPPNFISRETADSIPFSSTRYDEILRFFSISPQSPSAEGIQRTLKLCELPPIIGETRMCATSRESMLEFLHAAFDRFGGDFKVYGTTHWGEPTANGRREEAKHYKILSIKDYSAPRAAACHYSAYPYAVFYCHYFKGEAKVFMTQLEGDEDGERLEAAVLCHMDTSAWPPNQTAFRLLGTKPGTPVCHVFPKSDRIFLPNNENVAN